MEAARDEENDWAFLELNQICTRDPELAWELILEIFRASDNERVRGVLAAGPMEDLLANFGAVVIERVEALANSDDSFRALLRGIWKNRMSSDVWQRVQACRGKVGWQA